MAKITITDTGTMDPAEAVEFLEGEGHEVLVLNSTDPELVVEKAPDSEALIVSFIPVDRALMERLPQLKVVATMSVGYNGVDVEAARALDIDVYNMPSVAEEEVAAHALAGLLSITRFLPEANTQVKEGGWDYAALPMPARLSEQRLGLLALGRIARHLVTLATPVVGEIVAYDPYVSEEDWPSAVRRVHSLEELLQESDILSLHAPLTEESRGMIGERELALLPEGAFVVNVSRGGLIDEPALLAALESGQVRRAFLDTLATEPPPAGDPLVAHPHVTVSPHSAFRSAKTARDYVVIPAQNAHEALAGRRPATLVN
ncbi:C-terminal binding protein [Micrococcus sp.]|uniref:C-terminal binding protein n=1 Tax=Micrococcus sp. TaxID=1271 RepID=UPI002A91CC8F|nr:C-terminal binding protein [Micrococcus sp.]MDY6054522.1 C-terminal binding protein [Micrococcus sp.]